MNRGKYTLGIDIGGSHISAAVVDMASSRLVPGTFVREKVNPAGAAEEVIAAWAGAIGDSYARLGAGGAAGEVEPVGAVVDWRIGIAMPGPFDYEAGISLIQGLHKFESLYGLPVKQLLADRLGIVVEQIRMVNDASAFLLGEVMGGAGKGYQRAAGVTLGTGLGSAGYFSDSIEDGDLWCTPYRDSRAEDYLCSRWFVREYGAIRERRGEGPVVLHGVKELVPLYESDAEVRELFHLFGRNLGEVLLLKYPPSRQDIIIVGGNISGAWDLFIPATQAWCRERGAELLLRPAVLGEDAAVIGAAFLWR